MNKTCIFGTFFATLAMCNGAAMAAYPVYPMPTGTPQQQVVYLPTNTNAVITANSTVAANPTRVTGTLPRVGSNATAAGRKYYQPADYDRLADSGLYIGLSAGYSLSVMGGMQADYISDADSYLAPGAWAKADFKSDTVIPFQISLGAAINNDFRVDFSYLRYSGLSYPDTVQTFGTDTLIDATVTGGAITSNVTMLNVYYNIDSFTGYIAGGLLRPYIGAGIGLALNTIADYVVYDGSIYWFDDPSSGFDAESDIEAYHNGGTKEQLAFMLEGGLTSNISNELKLDLFVRYINLGKVESSGSIVASEILYPTGYDPYVSVQHYTDWRESGRLSTLDLGARLRLQF